MIQKSAISAAIICILLVSLIALIEQTSFGETTQDKKPFYVGVTYGGDNVQDAKTLIDKVANYTNLFVLQSGILKDNATAVNEIGDYAVSKGLHFAAYFDVLTAAKNAMWVGTAKQRWGDMFAGVYLGDEPGGKMLDGYTVFTLTTIKIPNSISNGTNTTGYTETSGKSIIKYAEGTLHYRDGTNYEALFYLNGEISVRKTNGTSTLVYYGNQQNNDAITKTVLSNTTNYEPNGSITLVETLEKVTINGGALNRELLSSNFYTMENGSDRIAQEETYQQVMSKNPMSDCNSAANLFVNKTSTSVADLKNQWIITKGSFPVFTADYGLYWWDYKSGYDMVLAELGWNNSVAQEIALVRGAANLQGKSWGTILTWKYTHAPYLADGEEIFDQMKTSYEHGAQYVILFNYAQDMSGPYGTLQEEHFQALERFWNEVVQNPAVIHGGVKAQAALVLPCNFGWGMRNPSDVIWGIWEPNSTSSQIWTQVQNKLEQYGTKLDIVYSDQAYPVAGKYANIYIWNKTP